jgi:cell wall-associated NlpC family hydrolase
VSAPAPDPRVNAYRADLAASDLKGRVGAPRYGDGTLRRVTASAAWLRRAPGEDQGIDTEALFGETVRVYDEREGWAWVQLEADRYVGYMLAAALGEVLREPTHRVAALRTHVYPAANIKAPPIAALPMNARVAIAGFEGPFARPAGGGYVFAGHLAAIDAPESDFVAVAERFLGVPYLWGGKTSLGLDCSALVQLSLDAAGIACPRDSDMQEARLGTTLPLSNSAKGLRRGDLVFWPGHVAIMADADTLLHASAHHMTVVREPFDTPRRRMADVGLEIAAVKRLDRVGSKRRRTGRAG